MSDFEYEQQGDVITKDEVEAKEPPMYKVILLNDDYTTMEFVVLVLQEVFRKTTAQAEQIMLKVHTEGAGTAGIYTKEVAETKVTIVHHLARQSEFPLKCIMESA